jgi:hypothetical protein
VITRVVPSAATGWLLALNATLFNTNPLVLASKTIHPLFLTAGQILAVPALSKEVIPVAVSNALPA